METFTREFCRSVSDALGGWLAGGGGIDFLPFRTSGWFVIHVELGGLVCFSCECFGGFAAR